MPAKSVEPTRSKTCKSLGVITVSIERIKTLKDDTVTEEVNMKPTGWSYIHMMMDDELPSPWGKLYLLGAMTVKQPYNGIDIPTTG